MIEYRQGLAVNPRRCWSWKSTVLRYLYGRYDARDDITAHLIPSPQWPSVFRHGAFLCSNFNVGPARSLTDQIEALRKAVLDRVRRREERRDLH